MAASKSKDELRCWARYLRDELSVAVVLNGGHLSSASLQSAEEFLTDLKIPVVDEAALRFSGIHNALMEMVGPDSIWPPELVEKAKPILEKWEAELGALNKIKPELWENGGRMYGLVKLRDDGVGTTTEDRHMLSWRKEKGHRTRPVTSSWAVERETTPLFPMRTGHNGFEIGHWWIKPAAAYRDGIIHSSMNGITADQLQAYAILMTGNQEMETEGENNIKYKASSTDPGRLKLLNNVISRNLVRVLRSWRLQSDLKPKVGLRYDGLYRVTGYAVKLFPNVKRGDEWVYVFNLERSRDQPGIEKALAHPTADEMDDWNEFQHQEQKRAESHTPLGLQRAKPRRAKSRLSEQSNSDEDMRMERLFGSRRLSELVEEDAQQEGTTAVEQTQRKRPMTWEEALKQMDAEEEEKEAREKAAKQKRREKDITSG